MSDEERVDQKPGGDQEGWVSATSSLEPADDPAVTLDEEVFAQAPFEGAVGAGIVIGQAGGTQLLNRPDAGQEVLIPAGSGGSYVLGFDPDTAQVSTEGGNLVLSFGDNGSRLVFSDFAGAVNSGTAPDFLYGGQTLAGQALYGQAQTLGGSGLAIEAAAGPGNGALGSGGSSYDDNLGSIIDLLGSAGVIEASAGEINTPEAPENDVVEEILLFEEEEEPEEPEETTDGGEYGEEYGGEDDGGDGGEGSTDGGEGGIIVLSGESLVQGDDTLTGGGDDETLTGADGPDSFTLDEGDLGGRITILNFDADEGDNLNLTAVLNGVDSETGADLDDHLSLAFGGGDTTITIDSNGADPGGEAATIVLAETDFSGLGASDAERIQALLDSGTLDAV